MNVLKKMTAIAVALITLVTSLTVTGAVKNNVKDVSIQCYCKKTFDVKKPKSLQSATYKYSVLKNKSNIKVSLYDYGKGYVLNVLAKKKTLTDKPVVTVYYNKSSSNKRVIVKKYRFTVKDTGEINFKDVKINEGTEKKVVLYNPFTKNYRFKVSNKKTASISNEYSVKGTKFSYPAKGLKKGDTTVKVYLKGTKTCVGEFKISVGTFPAKIKSKYKTVKLKYNSHGSSTYMSKSHILLNDILTDKRKNANYSVKFSSDEVLSTLGKNMIYAIGKGQVTATVYEKVGSAKKKRIGKFKINVKGAKMSYVAEENYDFYSDGIFGHGDFIEYLCLNNENSNSLNMESIIKSSLINNSFTGSNFKASQYKISYKSDNTNVAAVTSKGIVSAKNYGTAIIKYTINFSDKSNFTAYCPVDVSAE